MLGKIKDTFKEGSKISRTQEQNANPDKNTKIPAPDCAGEKLEGGFLLSEVKLDLLEKVQKIMDENPALAEYADKKLDEYANRIKNIKKIKGEVTDLQDIVEPPCKGIPFSKNCKECCLVFTDPELRPRFGYQQEAADVLCQCHDICVQDVKLICVKDFTGPNAFTVPIPCLPNGTPGCRGGFLPNGPVAIEDVKILCADECLRVPECDRVRNEIEFRVILNIAGTNIIMTPMLNFECIADPDPARTQWFAFPSGDPVVRDDFQNELEGIDGSCKLIIIEDFRTVTIGNDCFVRIELKVIDKLWKHENLLVSALQPYPDRVNDTPVITIKREFQQGHQIEPCVGGSCPPRT